MGHHSYLVIAGHHFLACRDSYIPEVAALFTEQDRMLVRTAGAEGPQTQFGYRSTAAVLRERLQVLGCTSARARADLDAEIASWSERSGPASDWRGPVPLAEQVLEEARRRLGTHFDSLSVNDLLKIDPQSDPIHALSWHMSPRSLVRLLLDSAPDLAALTVDLDLSELTGCCVEMDPDLPVAGPAREEQLADAAFNAPLLILTEGVTDGRLLAAGMEVTHPHLVGFVNFFDFPGTNAQGGASQLAKTATAFIAAGVANRFVVLADNDGAAHTDLATLKTQCPPERGVVVHYPPLEFLESYPTAAPDRQGLAAADVNQRAGSLEMYLGRDVLTEYDGQLMPVQWLTWKPSVGWVHGALAPADKKAAQKRFKAKVKAARAGLATGAEDWSGIRAIIDAIVRAAG
ncbi:HEPN/Toprim-associated domain-containing protein [Streptacidiphilus sp. EB103A]|uniref:HEPN/Toprim-associated domain-containing protein n=1 Tax=Streptacidiphilus sp. EB103A TaxID=3156275 RepID=UPI0035179FA8